MSKTITHTQGITVKELQEIASAVERFDGVKIEAVAYHQPRDVTPEGAEWQAFEAGPRKMIITITEEGYQE